MRHDVDAAAPALAPPGAGRRRARPRAPRRACRARSRRAPRRRRRRERAPPARRTASPRPASRRRAPRRRRSRSPPAATGGRRARLGAARRRPTRPRLSPRRPPAAARPARGRRGGASRPGSCDAHLRQRVEQQADVLARVVGAADEHDRRPRACLRRLPGERARCRPGSAGSRPSPARGPRPRRDRPGARARRVQPLGAAEHAALEAPEERRVQLAARAAASGRRCGRRAAHSSSRDVPIQAA